MDRLIDILLDALAVIGGMVTSFLLVLGALFLYYTKLYRLFHPEMSGIGAVAGGITQSVLLGALPGGLIALLLVVRRRKRAAPSLPIH